MAPEDLEAASMVDERAAVEAAAATEVEVLVAARLVMVAGEAAAMVGLPGQESMVMEEAAERAQVVPGREGAEQMGRDSVVASRAEGRWGVAMALELAGLEAVAVRAPARVVADLEAPLVAAAMAEVASKVGAMEETTAAAGKEADSM